MQNKPMRRLARCRRRRRFGLSNTLCYRCPTYQRDGEGELDGQRDKFYFLFFCRAARGFRVTTIIWPCNRGKRLPFRVGRRALAVALVCGHQSVGDFGVCHRTTCRVHSRARVDVFELYYWVLFSVQRPDGPNVQRTDKQYGCGFQTPRLPGSDRT